MNSTSDSNTNEASERIALFALNALSPSESDTFQANAIEGSIDADELGESLEVFTTLCEQVASAMPAPRRALKDAVMAAILPSVTDEKIDARDHIFVMADEGKWQTILPGIMIKVLYRSSETNRITYLARLEPGASYPSHRHLGVEECLVLEGDLRQNDVLMHAGDYTAAHADSIHYTVESIEGCLALICSPVDDEKLDAIA